MPKDFLSQYLEYASGQESPDIFHQWVAVTLIGTAAARNVYLNFGTAPTIFPNHYTILVAGSGMCRKSAALGMGMDIYHEALAEEVDRRIIYERITPEKLTRILAGTIRIGEGEDEYKYAPPTFIHSDELGAFLSRSAQQSGMVDLLGALYTCPKYHEYHTKTAGVDLLFNVCVNFLGATTPTWIQNNFTTQVFGEGFAGRTVFVYSDKPKQKIAIPTITDKERILREKLVNRLVNISKIRGEFKFSPRGKEYYTDWYESRPDRSPDEQTSGFYAREHAHVLKLAMVYALSAEAGLVLDELHLNAAVLSMTQIRESIPLALGGAGYGEDMQGTVRVIQYLQKKKIPVRRRAILNAVSRYMGTKGLEDALNNLTDSGRIKVTILGTGKNDILYSLASEEEMREMYPEDMEDMA